MYFTDEKLENFSLQLSKTGKFLEVYHTYIKLNPESVKFDNAEKIVLDFIKNFLIFETDLVTPTEAQAREVLEYYNKTYGLDFVYKLLPENIREYLDPDKVIQNLFRIYTEERNYFSALIQRLPILRDPLEAPEEYLDLLAKTVGLTLDYELPADIKRLMIFRAIPWYKIKGTTKSFNIIFRSMGLDSSVVELWTNYDQSRMETEPEVWPVVDGEYNPLYDPTDLEDGLIKYKTSFFDLELSAGGSVDPDVVSKALERLEDVRPITRTLRRIKFIIDFNDGEDLDPDPDEPSEYGETPTNGFPIPTDNLEGDGSKEFNDNFQYLTSSALSYGGVGFCPYFYDSNNPCNYDNSCEAVYDTSYYSYDNGSVLVFDGDIDYNSTSAKYDGAVTTTGLTYAGEIFDADPVTILMHTERSDDFVGLKLKYDHDPVVEGHLTYAFDATITYSGSDVSDFLEIAANIDKSFEDYGPQVQSDDTIIAIVNNGEDEGDRINETRKYSGEIDYSSGVTYGCHQMLHYDGSFNYDSTSTYGDNSYHYDNPFTYLGFGSYFYNQIAVFSGPINLETDPLEISISVDPISEADSYPSILADELEPIITFADSFSTDTVIPPTDDIEVISVHDLGSDKFFPNILNYGGLVEINYDNSDIYYDNAYSYGQVSSVKYDNAPDPCVQIADNLYFYDGSHAYDGAIVSYNEFLYFYDGTHTYKNEQVLSYNGTRTYDPCVPTADVNYSSDNLDVADYLDIVPTFNSEDSITTTDFVEVVNIFDFEDIVAVPTDIFDFVQKLELFDNFVEQVFYNGLDVDGSQLDHDKDDYITYGGRKTYSDTSDVLFENTFESLFNLPTDILDFTIDETDSFNSVLDELLITFSLEGSDRWKGVYYDGFFSYAGNVLWDGGAYWDSGIGWSIEYGEENLPFYGILEVDQTGFEDEGLTAAEDFEAAVISQEDENINIAEEFVGFLDQDEVDTMKKLCNYDQENGLTYSHGGISYNRTDISYDGSRSYGGDGLIYFYSGVESPAQDELEIVAPTDIQDNIDSMSDVLEPIVQYNDDDSTSVIRDGDVLEASLDFTPDSFSGYSLHYEGTVDYGDAVTLSYNSSTQNFDALNQNTYGGTPSAILYGDVGRIGDQAMLIISSGGTSPKYFDSGAEWDSGVKWDENVVDVIHF